MRRCAALLLLVSASLPGCGLTKTVWRGCGAWDEPDYVHGVGVTATGAVRVYYCVDHHPSWEIGFLDLSSRFNRLILIHGADMKRLLARAGTGAVREVSGEELRAFVLPSPAKGDVLAGCGPRDFRTEPDHVVTFPYPRGGEGVTARFHLPKARPPKPPSLLVRVLLTPPAAIADAAADVVLTVTWPVWLPILIALREEPIFSR